MKPPSAPPQSDVTARAILALLFVPAALPVLLTPIPAMVDYPNHLARMFVLSRDGTPAAHPFYQVTWALYPNLAMDLLVPPLGRILGVEAATRVFYLLSQLLVVTGAMTLERVVKGHIRISGFISVLFIYNLPFTWGFLNFAFGIGVALFGIASAVALQERTWPVRLVSYAVFSVLLFTAHFFTLGIYGVTVGLHESWRAWSRRTPPLEAAGRLVILALPASALIAIMASAGGAVGGEGTDWLLYMKPTWILAILNGYSLTVSAIGVAVFSTLIYLLAKRGALRFEQSGAWLTIGFIVLYIAMPSRLFDTSFVDLRVLVAAAFILPAFITVSFPDTRWRWAALGGVAIVALAQIATVAAVWTSYRAEYAAVRESFKQLGKGTKVLIGHGGEANDPPMHNLAEYPIYNAPTLAVHDADAYVPNFFAARGKQPVAVGPGLERLAVLHAEPAPVRLLKHIAEQGAPAGTPAFVRSWPKDFDYLYMLGPRVPNPMPALLEEIAAGTRFILYRIRKQS